MTALWLSSLSPWIIFLASLAVPSQSLDCTTARTCSQCVSISHQCRWCSHHNFKLAHRCGSHFSPAQCPADAQINPVGSMGETLSLPFSDSINRTVQLRPQRVRIYSRVGTISSVSVNFKQATDYPMDLYYLMDMSCTMIRHKKSVSRVGRKLADKIQSTTKDFRIGFGSYVDKESIPFANFRYNDKVSCLKTKMTDTYSFINHMRLNSNSAEFEEKVASAKISGNLDSPEGTLDALMQVMVCGDEIGWRKQSDKIIVVATDEGFHYAGDGKVGGVLIPNDGQCHLREGRYAASTVYDYPSMQHIAEVAQKNKFNLVFTVNDKIGQDYRILSDIVGANSHVASLKVDDDTIAELIDEVYRNISNQIDLQVEHKPDNVDVEIWTNCGLRDSSGHMAPMVRTPTCKVSGKTEIPFQIRIHVKHCQKGGSEGNTIRVGLLNKNESIEIELHQLCECQCELEGQPDSARCSHNGTFSCGICTSCNGIRSGPHCECDPDKPIDPNKPDAHCKKSGDSRSCSGHGQCVCGKCVCDSVFEGQFCENDQSACYQRGVKCNENGACVDSRCVCHEHFSGQFCECPLSNSTCVSDPHSGQVCSGRGECRCGKCLCKAATAYGHFCEKCPLCDAPDYCKRIETCLPHFADKFCRPQLNALTNSSESPCDFSICPETQQSSLLRWKFEMVDSLSDNATQEEEWSEVDSVQPFESPQPNTFHYQCQRVINGCDVSFLFRLVRQESLISLRLKIEGDAEESDLQPSDELLHFRVTNYTETCPQKVNLVVVGSTAFVVVFLVGLLTIVGWKVLTEYLDRREYERFMHEVDCANFSQTENPLYKEVTATFRNPAFGLRDRTSKFFFARK